MRARNSGSFSMEADAGAERQATQTAALVPVPAAHRLRSDARHPPAEPEQSLSSAEPRCLLTLGSRAAESSSEPGAGQAEGDAAARAAQRADAALRAPSEPVDTARCSLQALCWEDKLPPGPSKLFKKSSDSKVNAELQFSLKFALPRQDKAARDAPAALMRVCMDTGVHSFSLPANDCDELGEFCLCMDCRSQGGFLKLGERLYPGYGSYERTLGGGNNRHLQMRATAVVPRAHLDDALNASPPLRGIVDAVHVLLGISRRRLKAMHFLWQSCNLALFSWHRDHEDLRLSGSMVSVIVSLTDDISGMHVWGFPQPFVYRVCGDACAFPGAAWHRSVPGRSGAPVKLALFYD